MRFPKRILILLALVLAFFLQKSLFTFAPRPGEATSQSTVPPVAAKWATNLDSQVPQIPSDKVFGSFENWLNRLAKLNAAASDSFIKEGAQLATVRREEMRKLIAENPAAALARAVSWAQWMALPPEIQTVIEKPFSETGNLDVYPDCRLPEHRHGKWQGAYFTLNGKRHPASVYGRRASVMSKQNISAQGIVLDGAVALRDEAVQPLTTDDVAAISNHFAEGNPPQYSFLTGEPISGFAEPALIGGKIYYFASAEEIQALAESFADAEAKPGPKTVATAWAMAVGADGKINLAAFKDGVSTASSTWTETPKTVLCIRLKYSSGETTPYTQAGLLARMTTVSNYIHESSYGKTCLVPTVTAQALTLPQTKAYYESNGVDVLAVHAEILANNGGYNVANYDIRVYAMPPSGFGFAGVAGGNGQWLNGDVSESDIAHEFGHNYGVAHANLWTEWTGSGFSSHPDYHHNSIEDWEYADRYDRMGGGPFPTGHYCANFKAYLNWIEPSRIHIATNSGTYRIYRFDHANAQNPPNNFLAIKTFTSDGDEIWIGIRRAITNNAIASGANITWQYGNASRLIDPTPRSGNTPDEDRESAALALGKTWQDPSGKVRITPRASGGVSPYEYMDILVSVADTSPSQVKLYTSAALTTPGLVGSYVNSNLVNYAAQDDWRVSQPISGTRVDTNISFTSDAWGARAPLGLTGGSDADWDRFSVQWDGVIVIPSAMRIGSVSDDSSRVWIDLNQDGVFGSTTPEFINNKWGVPHNEEVFHFSDSIGPGTFPIRIQYQEGTGYNRFHLATSKTTFELFRDPNLKANGLTGSYINSNLRGSSAHDDWRISKPVAGTRADPYPGFRGNSDWGLSRAAVGLTNGTDNDWDEFSVQWDGWLLVREPSQFWTASDDSSRMWIDLNNDGVFNPAGNEFIDNHWGVGQSVTYGALSSPVANGLYRIRMQYEEGSGDNSFILLGTSSAFVEEHGNSMAEATLLASANTSIAGDVIISDNDYFRIRLNEYGRLKIYTEGTADPYGYLLDAAGTVLAQDNNSTNANNFLINYTNTSLGDFYIRVHGATLVSSGGYTLVVQFQPTLPTQSVTPTNFNFDVLAGMSATNVIQIQNVASQQSLLNYSVSSSQPWLTVNPVSGTSTGEVDVITVVANSTNLTSSGVYLATVKVVSSVATNTIPVQFTVSDPYFEVATAQDVLSSNPLSLRSALAQAMTWPRARIGFNPSAMGTNTITLNGSPLVITGNVDVAFGSTSSPPAGIVLNANYASRIFEVGTNSRLRLNDLVLTRGSNNVGGNIFAMNGSRVEIVNCLLSDGKAARGGALCLSNATVAITNSTFTSNTVTLVGGAIYLAGSGQLDLWHSTIARNTAAVGGGVYRAGDATMTANLSHVAFADNTPSDLFGSFASQGYNLVPNPNGFTRTNPPATDILGTNARIASVLRDNGGSTATLALLWDSPAIDAGQPSLTNLPATDQRNLARVAGARVDIGAYELDTTQVFTEAADMDNDGMRDAWEQFYGLNWNDAGDALLDADGDGFANVMEDGAGTNPQNSLSLLRLSLQSVAATNLNLVWAGVTNRWYDLQMSTNLSGDWSNVVTNIAGQSGGHNISVPRQSSSSFYRIRVRR